MRLGEDDVSRVRQLKEVLLDMDWWLHELVHGLSMVERSSDATDEDLYRVWESIQQLKSCLAKLEERYRELLAKLSTIEIEKL